MNIDQRLLRSSYSRAGLRVLSVGDRAVVEKRFVGDLDRAARSIEKQRRFAPRRVGGATVRSVPILDHREQPGEILIRMPYIDGISAGQFASLGDKAVADLVRNCLDGLLEREMAASSFQPLKPDVFIRKSEAILAHMAGTPLAGALGRAHDEVLHICRRQLRFPVGPCHGDLTLSNMIARRATDLFLVDFLGCFVESPLQDVAKVLQDFRYGWTFRKEPRSLQLKARIFCECSLPPAVAELAARFPAQVRLLTVLTIMRIAPYVQDEATGEWLAETLSRLADERS